MNKRTKTTTDYVVTRNESQLGNMSEEQQKNAVEAKMKIEQLSTQIYQQIKKFVTEEEQKRKKQAIKRSKIKE